MNINHRYIIAGILFVTIIITGTTAYDSVTADRSVDVSVVEDGDAYLAIETRDLENESVVPAFKLTNNLNRNADLKVDVTDPIENGASVVNITVGESSDERETSEKIAISKGKTAELNIECSDASKSYDIGLEIILETTDIEIDVDRKYTLECNDP
jgi:hypothetical protein